MTEGFKVSDLGQTLCWCFSSTVLPTALKLQIQVGCKTQTHTQTHWKYWVKRTMNAAHHTLNFDRGSKHLEDSHIAQCKAGTAVSQTGQTTRAENQTGGVATGHKLNSSERPWGISRVVFTGRAGFIRCLSIRSDLYKYLMTTIKRKKEEKSHP